MFFPNRLIYRVKDSKDVLSFACLPFNTDVKIETISPRRRKDNLRAMAVGEEMVAFVDPEDPEAILKDPVLQEILETHAKVMFVIDEKTGKKNLSGDVVTVPVVRKQLGTAKRLHITTGGTFKGSPKDDDYSVPQSWRDAAGRLAPVVKAGEASKTVGVYLDERFRDEQNAEAAIKALARGLGNVAYRGDLFRSDSQEQYVDGVLPKPDNRKQKDDPAGVSYSIRRALGRVFLVSEKVSVHELGKMQYAFQDGDWTSCLQTLARFLAETPHNLLDCETFVKVLKNMAAVMDVLGLAKVEVQIFGPSDSKMTTNNFDESGELKVLQAVHAGAFKEKGPFLVRIKYRHPRANGQPVNVHIGKSVMQDDGGENAKGSAAKDMQADMLGGAAVAVEMCRVALDNAQGNHDFVFPIVSNRIGGGYQMNDILRLSSGRTVEILNTDAEGRLILADGLGFIVRMLHVERNRIGQVNCVDTLTGHAIVMGGNMNAVVGDNRALLRAIEDASIANGEAVQGIRLQPIDKGITKKTPANLRNLHSLPIGSMSARGAQSGAEFIFEGAGLSEKTRRDAVNWDIASSLENYKGGAPGDLKDWLWTVGEFLDTFHARVMGRIGAPTGRRRAA